MRHVVLQMADRLDLAVGISIIVKPPILAECRKYDEGLVLRAWCSLICARHVATQVATIILACCMDWFTQNLSALSISECIGVTNLIRIREFIGKDEFDRLRSDHGGAEIRSKAL